MPAIGLARADVVSRGSTPEPAVPDWLCFPDLVFQAGEAVPPGSYRRFGEYAEVVLPAGGHLPSSLAPGVLYVRVVPGVRVPAGSAERDRA